MSFLANRNVQIFNSTMSVSTLNTSAMAISTLTGSSLTASTINVSTLNTNATNFSTLTGSTLNASTSNISTLNTNNANFSTLTGSTLTASTISVSTLNTNNANFSTLTGSTLTASTISVSTLNTNNANFSTLTGSTLTASSIIGSTLSISTLTGSTLTATRIGYSTLSGSSIISNDLVLSTLTVSSINSGAPGVGAYSTFNASSINVNSTLTASTMNGSTINLSTLNTSNANVSTLTGSTLSVSTMTGSTLTISRLTGLIITTSTLSASSMTSGDLVLSTLTVSSINGLPPGTGSGGSGGTTIFSTLGVSSLNANSTITTSTLIANSYVGIGSTAISGKLSVNAGATNNLALSLTSAGPGWGSGMQLINNTATTGRNYGIYAGSDGALHIPDSTAGADRVLINSLGNVGIGTNSPGYLLDVNGTLNIRGSFTVNGTAVATGTGSVWTVGASNCIYYSAGNTCLYRNRLVFSNAINDFNHSIFNNSSNWDGEGSIDGFKYNGYNCHWFRVGNASGAVPTTAIFMNSSGQTVIGNTTDSQSNLLRVFGGNTTSGISLGDYMASTGVKYIGITNITNGANVAASSGFSGITFGSPYDGGGTSGYLAFHTHGYGISSDERMRIDKGGKIGIGKTNPSQLLDVNGAINCTSFLVNGVAVATGTGSVWGVNGSSAYYTSGNVGISTTAPNTNLNIRVGTYSSPVLIVDAGGQGTDITPPRGIGKPLIGVGANSWSNVSSGDYYGIGFGYNANNNAASYYPGEIGFLIQSTAGGEYGDMVFSTRPTTTNTTIASERMRITSAGNIGIGTTSVSYPLDLYNSSSILARFQNPGDYARIVLDGATGTGGDLIFKAAGVSKYGIACISNKLQFLLNDSLSTIPMTLDASGNVGIGTGSPVYPLTLKTSANTSGMTHTDGTIIVGSYVGGSVTAGWYGTTSNHPLCFFTNNSAASMTINTSSQVGIGTVTPGYKLQVYSTTANDGILFQNAYNSSTGSIGLFTSTAAGNFILDGTADAGIIIPTAGKDLFLNRTTALYTSMVIKGGTGNVGIGTATPAYLTSISSSGFINLEINRTGAGTLYGAGIMHSLTSSTGSFRGEYAFAFGGATTIATSAQTQAYGYYAIDLANAGVFTTNTGNYTSSYFFVNTSSACFPKTNVGIGTASPGAPLHIYSATADYSNSFIINTSWPSIRLGNSSVTGRDWVILNGGTGAGIGVGNFGIYDVTAGAYRLMINSTGNVGIGNLTASLSKLYVDAVTDVSTGICQINGGASNVNSKAFLSGKSNAALMPSFFSNIVYFYGTSGTTPYTYQITASTYFTGQHANQPIDPVLKTNIQDYVGLIVSSADQGYYTINPATNEISTGIDAITITEALPYIELTTTDQDPAIWGVLTNVKNDTYDTDGTTPLDNTNEWGDRLGTMVRVNGLGEGALWVTNINGNIRNGDLICSSAIPGYGRKQDDDLFHSYTVAKTTMSCNFDLSTTKYRCKTITHDGTEYIAAFIGCTYHCS